jgi:hypothetical protein
MTILVVLAAHQGEEFVIILPAIMLIGAFFIMRWANQNDKGDDDEAAEDGPREERPEGFVLPKLKIDDEVVLSGAASSRARPDADETTR